MPYRVLLMARELNLGGSERQMTEVARFLDRDEFDPRVGCFFEAGIRGDELRGSGVPVVRFPVQSYKSLATLTGARALARYIREERIALVHAFDYPLNVFAVPVTRLFTCAVAVASQRSHRGLVPGGYLRVMRMTDHTAHSVVVNCEYLKRHLIEDEHIAPAKIEVCYNGIDLDKFRPEPSDRPPTIRDASFVISVVCGLRPEKGLPTLLDAFARVRSVRPGMKLAIVGSGPMLAELEARARELGIQDECAFEPATARVPDWLGATDIFVLPSRSEAFSNAIMEAMACGCCVVASNVGGNPELVQSGRTGLLFDAGSAESLAAVLQRLLDDDAERHKLAANGQRFIRESFSIEASARRMGEIYRQLIRRHGQTSLVDTQEAQAARSGERRVRI